MFLLNGQKLMLLGAKQPYFCGPWPERLELHSRNIKLFRMEVTPTSKLFLMKKFYRSMVQGVFG